MNSMLSFSFAKRFGIAAVFGAGITVLLLGFVALLNGAFVERNLMTVTPCYFTAPDGRIQEGIVKQGESALVCAAEPPKESGIVSFFRNFTRSGSGDDNATALEQLKREGFTR